MEYPFDYNSISGFGPIHDFAPFYERLVDEAPIGATIVELGCYHGRSLIQLGLYARASGKDIKIWGYDHCAGQSLGLSETVRNNIKNSGLEDYIVFDGLASIEAARTFADETVWCAFLDDGHLHEEVAAGIDAWMPKIRKDGLLAGHDAKWYTVWQVCKAKLSKVLHDPTWPDCWFCSKCEVIPNNKCNIHADVTLDNFGYGKDGLRSDGKPSGSPLLSKFAV